MLDILILAILNSFFCTGIYVATQFTNSDQFDDHPDVFRNQPIKGKMLLWWIRYYGSYLPEFFRKPIYLCLPCMASIWSVPFWSIFCIYIGLNPIESISLWFLYVGSVCGINTLISYNAL